MTDMHKYIFGKLVEHIAKYINITRGNKYNTNKPKENGLLW